MQEFELSPEPHELLRVTGPDADRFLQGQLTCDVTTAGPDNLLLGAACNNKGRIISPFVLIKDHADFLLLFRKGLADRFAAAMRKFLPFYKCRIDAEPEIACVGLGAPQATDWLTTQGWALPGDGHNACFDQVRILRVPGALPQLMVLGPATTLAGLGLLPPAATGREADWPLLMLRNGHYPFSPEDSEVFTPQELRYDEREYVSFSKGCYTGQEIVARMHYRGKPKKRLYRIELNAPAGLSSGPLTLLDDEGRPLAECSKVTRLPDGGCIALASLPIEFAEQHPSVPSSTGAKAQLTSF